MASPSFILTLSCQDRPGIVFETTRFLVQHQLNILESAQYGDPSTFRFFLRIHFAVVEGKSDLTDLEAVRTAFRPVGDSFEGVWELHGAAEKLRVCILVSKIGHCLNDLLFRQRNGSLPISVPLVVSNHPEYASLAASYNIVRLSTAAQAQLRPGQPFHHLTWTKDTKVEAEKQLLELIAQHDIHLVVLARFMQIVSADFCHRAPRIINIHHSFLPSFAGARPYHQAFDKGVKAIGATAHFATADLDEGPIIEQDVVKVTHNMDPARLTTVGATIEATVLARAVRWYAERRVLLNGTKTVVFN